jgi:phosphatase NudJ
MSQRHTARVIVAGFIERDGKILIIREQPSNKPEDHPVVINQPTGHVEKDELLTEAVKREVLEETGYKVIPKEIIGVHQATLSSRDYMAIYFLFRCEIEDETQGPIEAPEIIETLWLTPEEIMSRQSEHRSETTTARFKNYFNGNRFPLEVITQITK